MRILFAGTPAFAATTLAALIGSDHQVLAVLSQPDRPAGRGRALQASPVKQCALAAGLPVLQPASLKTAEIQQQLAAWQADVMVVVAYGLIIPPFLLALPRYGCLNIHASLLPRWRGAAPIQRAIAAGDRETGVAIMQMEAGLDTGPVLLERRTAITADDNGGTLHDRLAEIGAETLLAALADLPALQQQAQPQLAAGVCYADKLSKEEARIDWRKPAAQLAREVRAFNPWPVSWFAGQALALAGPVRVWQASAGDGRGAPGTLLASAATGPEVACGEGSLRLEELQLPGKKRQSASAIQHGHAALFAPGTVLS